MTIVPQIRIRQVNSAPLRPNGAFVLYWMTANRRVEWNFALDRAIEWSLELGKPLVILEALRLDYPFAGDRLHLFVMQGMVEHGRRLAGKPCLFYPYVEPDRGRGCGLLEALSALACLVVTDDYPCFFLPRMLAAASRRLEVCLECVDANGLLPLDAADRVFVSAHHFRRFLQKNLPSHLNDFPRTDPFSKADLSSVPSLPKEITDRWPPLALDSDGCRALLSKLPIDHRVPPVKREGGGSVARVLLEDFVAGPLKRYDVDHNHPDRKGASELSPYLHFGRISVHEVFEAVMREGDWFPEKLANTTKGQRAGWWGVIPPIEAFLDQLVTWRELGFNMCRGNPHYDRYQSLPTWALETLEEHRADPRPVLYTLEELESAETGDEIWNAAQRQLIRQGFIHNYLRMLWGKKILEWTSQPEEALEIMIRLNDRWALDGRDPNSYSGIFWVLGRYDRGFKERSIFGKVRYMSSPRARQKLKISEYLKEFGE